MRPTPQGWPRISSSIFYDEPRAAIDWLCSAFGFQVRLLVEGDGGAVEHSELTFGEGLIMVGQSGGRAGRPVPLPARSPRALGGMVTQAMCLFVDDVDAHCERARTAGATIHEAPRTSDYGDDYWSDRSYAALDLEGHLWWFMQRLRTGRGG